MPQLFKKQAKIGEGPRLKDRLVLQRGHASTETCPSPGNNGSLSVLSETGLLFCSYPSFLSQEEKLVSMVG